MKALGASRAKTFVFCVTEPVAEVSDALEASFRAGRCFPYTALAIRPCVKAR